MTEKDEMPRLMAYQGQDGCESLMCRRFWGGKEGLGTCCGWHCAICHEPSSQYGHKECEVP